MNKYKVLIEGSNVNRFILDIYKRNIYIDKIERINNKKCILVLNKDNYIKLKSIKTIYKIKLINVYGINYIKNILINNYIFVISLILGIILLNILSNMIFDIEIKSNDKEIIEVLTNELNRYDIKKYSFKKSYKTRSIIKENILNNNKDLLEWIEIESIGTKYIIKVERRVIKSKKETCKYRDIISKKDGIIKDIKVDTGEIKKEVNDYVRKNDVIVSGIITKNEEEKRRVCASGKILGEVWYQVKIDIPINYKEEVKTNNYKKNISITLFNKRYSLFKSYKNKEIEELYLKNNIIPIKLSLEKEREIVKVDKIYTDDELDKKIFILGRDKLEEKIGKDSVILTEKKLKKYEKNSRIYIVIFYRVLEDITSFK